jgi:hypothetical protein
VTITYNMTDTLVGYTFVLKYGIAVKSDHADKNHVNRQSFLIQKVLAE